MQGFDKFPVALIHYFTVTALNKQIEYVEYLESSSGLQGFTFPALWFDPMEVDSAIYVLIAAVTPVEFLVSLRVITSEVS